MNDKALIAFLENQGTPEALARVDMLRELDTLATKGEPKGSYAQRKLAELRAETVQRTLAAHEPRAYKTT